jgi:hypothetical protein
MDIFKAEPKIYQYFSRYVGVMISLWLFLLPIFLFAAQPNDFFLDRLKRFEQRNHKCVELRGNV